MASVIVEQNTARAVWEDLSGNGEAVGLVDYPDKTVQAVGTGVITVEGSPDGTNWAELNNAAGTPISLDQSTDANAAEVILENTVYVRAVVTGGTATVTIVGVRY